MADIHDIGPYLARLHGIDRGVPPWQRLQRIQVGKKRYKRFSGEEMRWLRDMQRLCIIAEDNPRWAHYIAVRLGQIKSMPWHIRPMFDALRQYIAYSIALLNEMEEELE